jgi:hypothetical protein
MGSCVIFRLSPPLLSSHLTTGQSEGLALSALAALLIHDGKKIGQCLLALRRVRRSRPKRFQSAVDCLVDLVPVWRGTRLSARLCFVPRRLKVFDARLRGGKVALLSQGLCIDYDRPEL